MPGRMVRSQEPKEFQTSRGWATVQRLKQSLADDAGLDEDVVSVKLALDVVAVLERGTMEMLIAAVAAPRLHVGHPEMVGEGTDSWRTACLKVCSILKRRP